MEVTVDIDEEDEYGNIDEDGETFIAESHTLESGKVLVQVPIRYKTFGTLNDTATNCMVVCHALTGNASLDDWWGSMLGMGKLFDDTKMFIVCANVLGSCYGSCGPTSTDPVTGNVYGASFPDVTVRDTVNIHLRLVRDHLRVRKVACVVGGSFGGMQALEWAVIGGSSYVNAIIPMCCGAFHHPWQIGISESQRQAIYADPAWSQGNYLSNKTPGPKNGLSVARSIAMITYRSHRGYQRKFDRLEVHNQAAGNGQERYFQVERYLRHQGVKFNSRFDAQSYVKVTRSMDTHDLGRAREGGVIKVLQSITQPTFIVSVKSDILYPPSEQEFLYRYIPLSTLFNVESDHGHDGFLLDQHSIMPAALDFLHKHVYNTLTARL